MKSEWTIGTLRAYFKGLHIEQDRRYTQRFDAQEKAVAAALSAAEKAVTKAEIAAEKRFDSVNEFRAQLADQAGTFYPRLEADQRFKSLEEKIGSVIRACVGAVVLCIAIITVVLLILKR